MKKPYIIFTNDDEGWYKIIWVGYNENAGKVRYNHATVNFFEIAPEDEQYLLFWKLTNLTDEQIELLQSCVGLTSDDLTEEQRDIMDNISAFHFEKQLYVYDGSDISEILDNAGLEVEDVYELSSEQYREILEKYAAPFRL